MFGLWGWFHQGVTPDGAKDGEVVLQKEVVEEGEEVAKHSEEVVEEGGQVVEEEGQVFEEEQGEVVEEEGEVVEEEGEGEVVEAAPKEEREEEDGVKEEGEGKKEDTDVKKEEDVREEEGREEAVEEEDAEVCSLEEWRGDEGQGWESTLRLPVVDGWECLDVLGVGAFGTVYRAQKGGEEGAVKKVWNGMEGREATVLEECVHPNVLRCFSVVQSQGYQYLVTELLGSGSLRDLLDDPSDLTACVAEHMVHQVTQGLAYLHSRHIIHRDVKPSNIMLDGPLSSPRVVLIDVGVCTTVCRVDQTMFKGSVEYLAPEVLEGKHFDCRSDIYSLGVVVKELLAKCSVPSATLRLIAEQCLVRDVRSRGEAVDIVTLLEHSCTLCDAPPPLPDFLSLRFRPCDMPDTLLDDHHCPHEGSIFVDEVALFPPRAAAPAGGFSVCNAAFSFDFTYNDAQPSLRLPCVVCEEVPQGTSHLDPNIIHGISLGLCLTNDRCGFIASSGPHVAAYWIYQQNGTDIPKHPALLAAASAASLLGAHEASVMAATMTASMMCLGPDAVVSDSLAEMTASLLRESEITEAVREEGKERPPEPLGSTASLLEGDECQDALMTESAVLIGHSYIAASLDRENLPSVAFFDTRGLQEDLRASIASARRDVRWRGPAGLVRVYLCAVGQGEVDDEGLSDLLDWPGMAVEGDKRQVGSRDLAGALHLATMPLDKPLGVEMRWQGVHFLRTLVTDLLPAVLPQLVEHLQHEAEGVQPVGYLLEGITSPTLRSDLYWLLCAAPPSPQRNRLLETLVSGDLAPSLHSQKEVTALANSLLNGSCTRSEAFEPLYPWVPATPLYPLARVDRFNPASGGMPGPLEVLIGLEGSDAYTASYCRGKDLRKECLVAGYQHLFNLFLSNRTRISFTPSRAVPTSLEAGYIEQLPGAPFESDEAREVLLRVQHEAENSIPSDPPSNFPHINNYVCSCVSWTLLSYILGLRDGYTDTMVSPDGTVWYTGFTHILQGCHPEVLTEDKVRAMGGLQSPWHAYYVARCIEGIMALREHADLLTAPALLARNLMDKDGYYLIGRFTRSPDDVLDNIKSMHTALTGQATGLSEPLSHVSTPYFPALTRMLHLWD